MQRERQGLGKTMQAARPLKQGGQTTEVGTARHGEASRGLVRSRELSG